MDWEALVSVITKDEKQTQTLNWIFGNEFFVKASHAEALDLLRGWQNEGSLLICKFSFSRFVAEFRGRVRDVNGSDVQLFSDDVKSGLAIRLGSDLDFGYGDVPAFPEDLARSDRGLVVMFPKAATLGEPEVITFTEVPRERCQSRPAVKD